MDGLVDEIVLAFRHRLVEVGREMGEARDPETFAATERELLQMARELAAEMTGRILQQVSDDKERRKEALAAVREKADTRGIEVRTERDRVTPVRTLGGQTVRIKTAYASSRPRGGKKLPKRGKDGTGVYPVLDQLGIVGRSTPALRLLVSRAVCEANSVDSARDLLAEGGVVIDHKAALRLTYLVTDDALRARREAMRAQEGGCDDGPFAGRRVVAAVDGGRVNIRRRVAGRPRKGGCATTIIRTHQRQLEFPTGCSCRRGRSVRRRHLPRRCDLVDGQPSRGPSTTTPCLQLQALWALWATWPQPSSRSDPTSTARLSKPLWALWAGPSPWCAAASC